MKLHGKKLKMDQLWLDDKVAAVTPVKIIDAGAELGDINVGDRVHVAGITKGHGFQGVVKRHNFSGGPKSHGQKNRYRAPGSIGSTAPQRVVPGRKMAGHMGVERVTVKNLRILKIDPELKTIFFKGAIPGNRGGKVEIYQ